MIIYELLEPWPVEHAEFGKGEALLIECGHSDYKYTCVFGRALITVPQKELLLQRDYTNNRGLSAKELWTFVVRAQNVTSGRRSKRRA